MAVRHYAHQYTMQLTDEKIIDGNVSSESSDEKDYYPLIRHTMNSAIVNANTRRRGKEASWDETVRLLSLSFSLHIITSISLYRRLFKDFFLLLPLDIIVTQIVILSRIICKYYVLKLYVF